jgi:transposase InsO family protein
LNIAAKQKEGNSRETYRHQDTERSLDPRGDEQERIYKKNIQLGYEKSDTTIQMVILNSDNCLLLKLSRYRHDILVAEDCLKQDFSAEAVNRVWFSDITFIWTKEGSMYLAAILDAYDRQIVGWMDG